MKRLLRKHVCPLCGLEFYDAINTSDWPWAVFDPTPEDEIISTDSMYCNNCLDEFGDQTENGTV